MKITHVESFRVHVPAATPPFRWRDGLAGSAPAGEGGILRIGTDVGVEGVAFFSRPGAAVMLDDLVERVFRPELVGQDPLQREWLWHRVWELDRIHELPLPTLGLIDIALWDLAGPAREAAHLARARRLPHGDSRLCLDLDLRQHRGVP